jgi:hypothetical protein
MSVQLKFKDGTPGERRNEIVHALARAGFSAQCLFPDQQRARLASIYSISKAGAGDLREINSALARYESDIEFVEAAPERKPKG